MVDMYIAEFKWELEIILVPYETTILRDTLTK